MKLLKTIRHHRIDEPDMIPLEVGDIVEVTDTGEVYVSYTAIARKLRKIDQLHWVYKGFPNMEHKFKIIAIFDHVEEDDCDHGKYAIVIQDTATAQVYITNELGITFLRNATKSTILNFPMRGIKSIRLKIRNRFHR